MVNDLTLVTRRLKPSGRGQKNITIPQIVSFAQENDIKWRQVEEQEEFNDLQNHSNLAIAVSYGRKIPSSLISSLEYGGLNVHPSLLPQYRGASPLQYAIMNQNEFSGVSVQTLHPTKFDHGQILWQSSPTKLSPREDTPSLTVKLSSLGAQGLEEVLSAGDVSKIPPLFPNWESSRAPVIPTSLHKIDFGLAASQLDARGRAISKLYFDQKVEQKKTKSGKLKGHPVLRVNLASFEEVHGVPSELAKSAPTGAVIPAKSLSGHMILALKCRDGFLGASKVTVQGFKSETAAEYFVNKDKRKLKEVVVNI